MPDDLEYLNTEFYRRINNVRPHEELEMQDIGINLEMDAVEGVLFLKFESQEDLNFYKLLGRIKENKFVKFMVYDNEKNN